MVELSLAVTARQADGWLPAGHPEVCPEGRRGWMRDCPGVVGVAQPAEEGRKPVDGATSNRGTSGPIRVRPEQRQNVQSRQDRRQRTAEHRDHENYPVDAGCRRRRALKPVEAGRPGDPMLLPAPYPQQQHCRRGVQHRHGQGTHVSHPCPLSPELVRPNS